MLDCVEGVKRAIELGWYTYKSFDSHSFQSMLEVGDLSWIVPGQIIAFSSPTDGSARTHPAVRPQQLVNTFKALNVKGVIRLNDKLYHASPFEREGIKVHEMEFPDGSNPNDNIISRYVAISEQHIG